MRKILKIYMIVSLFLFSCNKDSGTSTFNPDADVTNNGNNNINNTSSFRVTLVEPSHGPVAGGEVVTIRGFGFEDGSRIFFGEHMADPDNTVFVAPNRMICPSPAGEVGTVSVSVVRSNGEKTTLENAYTYDRFSLEPSSGSMTGGTLIRISSPMSDFEEGDTLYLGGQLLDGVKIISPNMAVAVTPSHSPESVDLKVVKQDGTEYVTPDAFLYYDSTDPAYGGMSGNPLNGTLTVTVLNMYGREPVEGAFVFLGADPQYSPFKGCTDTAGQITFSDTSLHGIQMLTVVNKGFENLSVVGFDSDEITVFLNPLAPPSNPGGGIPGIPTTVYAHVAGSVNFKLSEFKYGCSWDHMLEPAPEGWVRVVKILQTLGSTSIASPQVYKIYETDTCVEGFGYPFEITVYPGSFALFAIAGYETFDGKTFIPSAYGVMRNIIVGASETVSAELDVESLMADKVNVVLRNAPPLDPENGPVSYHVKVITDLGTDGYLVFNDSEINTDTADATLVFEHLPSISGKLGDASRAVFAEAQNNGSYPFSQVLAKDETSDTIIIDQFLTPPSPSEPTDSTPFTAPSVTRFAFKASSPNIPSFHVIKINTFPASDPYWRIYMNGEINSFVLPDFNECSAECSDESEFTCNSGNPSAYCCGILRKQAGSYYWHIQSVLIDDMDFNNFTYRYLSNRYWKANAADGSKFGF